MDCSRQKRYIVLMKYIDFVISQINIKDKQK